jgi:hypothetical protein
MRKALREEGLFSLLVFSDLPPPSPPSCRIKSGTTEEKEDMTERPRLAFGSPANEKPWRSRDRVEALLQQAVELFHLGGRQRHA